MFPVFTRLNFGNRLKLWFPEYIYVFIPVENGYQVFPNIVVELYTGTVFNNISCLPSRRIVSCGFQGVAVLRTVLRISDEEVHYSVFHNDYIASYTLYREWLRIELNKTLNEYCLSVTSDAVCEFLSSSTRLWMNIVAVWKTPKRDTVGDCVLSDCSLTRHWMSLDRLLLYSWEYVC